MPTPPKTPNSAATYRPQYVLPSSAQIHSHIQSPGSVVVDRRGTSPPLQGDQAAVDGSFTQREQTIARSQSPISPFSQFEPGIFPPGVDPSALNAHYTLWKQSQGY
jgi:hypothetical protein